MDNAFVNVRQIQKLGTGKPIKYDDLGIKENSISEKKEKEETIIDTTEPTKIDISRESLINMLINYKIPVARETLTAIYYHDTFTFYDIK